MRNECWITKVTHTRAHTHSEYVIIIVFPRQQWLGERAEMLRHTYIANANVQIDVSKQDDMREVKWFRV